MPDESINVASITSFSTSHIYIFNSTARLLLRNNNESRINLPGLIKLYSCPFRLYSRLIGFFQMRNDILGKILSNFIRTYE
jgi:hypothetical protein